MVGIPDTDTDAEFSEMQRVSESGRSEEFGEK
jgi:hypothetical protein